MGILLAFAPFLIFVPIIVTVGAIWGAAKFTSWYPEREGQRRSE